jgi:hypothetical protein
LEATDPSGTTYYWFYRSAICPGNQCGQSTIELQARWPNGTVKSDWRQVFPLGANRGPVPPEVPAAIADDYIEACNVLPISAKARHPLRFHGGAYRTCCAQTVIKREI